jgi:hypothetical protein
MTENVAIAHHFGASATTTGTGSRHLRLDDNDTTLADRKMIYVAVGLEVNVVYCPPECSSLITRPRVPSSELDNGTSELWT